MVMTDPIADMLTRVRNSIRSGHRSATMPSSNIKVAISKIFKEEGYIENFKVLEKPRNKRELVLQLRKAPSGEMVMTGLERVSRPGCRVYADKDHIPVVLGGVGTAIISTSRGIMSGEEARKRRLGGEVLCRVW